MKIEVRYTPEFMVWLSSLSSYEQIRITRRINLIQEEGHLGDFKCLGDHLYELRWKNGWRIYFTRKGHVLYLILIGGLKNGQKKDIKKAKNLFKRYI